ncbi:MAG: hypothetical protein HY898_05515 [Deltaproteobacteria bacterium]|nr:hypothetical protein [Deltaproteobacteria bacterium]
MRIVACAALVVGLCGCGGSDSSPPATSAGGSTGSAGSAGSGGSAGAQTGGSGGSAGGAGSCAAACTGEALVCDPADSQCKPDGTTTDIGAPCSTSGADPACGTDANATCNDQTQDGFPGGYCSVEPCTTLKLCPMGSSCAHLGAESMACFKNCSNDADCRGPDYVCQDATGLWVSGASHSVCYLKTLACNKDLDCPTSHPKCVLPDAAGLGSCT